MNSGESSATNPETVLKRDPGRVANLLCMKANLKKRQGEVKELEQTVKTKWPIGKLIKIPPQAHSREFVGGHIGKPPCHLTPRSHERA